MERIHVAVFPFVGSGHVNPMVELSRRLIQHGFRVTIILTEDDCADLSSEDYMDYLQIPNVAERISLQGIFQEMKRGLEYALKDMEVCFKCIISDWFLGWTQDVANNMCIPRVSFATTAAICEVIYSHIPLLLSKGYIPVNDNPDDNTLITFIPGLLKPLHRRDLPLALHEYKPGTEALGNTIQRMQEGICILVNTVEELEQEIVDARRSQMNYLPVGPLLPSEFLSDEGHEKSRNCLKENGLSILKWLDNHPCNSVLYIAFGSVVSVPVALVETLADAVQASGHSFIWAIRRNFVYDGSEDVFETLVKRFGDQGLVVDWAPQVHVLRHESIGAFFTHCGWNSTMESVCSGVPTICWPCDAEQNLNANEMADRWRIGKKVAEGKNAQVSVEEVERVIRLVMDENGEGGELRRRCEELKRVVRGAYHGGSSDRNLRCLKDIICGSINK